MPFPLRRARRGAFALAAATLPALLLAACDSPTAPLPDSRPAIQSVGAPSRDIIDDSTGTCRGGYIVGQGRTCTTDG